MIRLPPISTRTDTLFPYTRASDLDVAVAGDVLVEHLPVGVGVEPAAHVQPLHHHDAAGVGRVDRATHHDSGPVGGLDLGRRSEEHTSELQSLMRISYAVFCSNKNKEYNAQQ